MISLERSVPGVCGHCGRPDVGTRAAGYGGLAGTLLCRPNAAGRPDCYRLVTVHRHPMDCRCEERYPMATPRRG